MSDDNENNPTNEYPVEAFLKHHPKTATNKNDVESYFVKWENYDKSENSWISAEYTSDCQELLDKYWQKFYQKQKAKIEKAKKAKQAEEAKINASKRFGLRSSKKITIMPVEAETEPDTRTLMDLNLDKYNCDENSENFESQDQRPDKDSAVDMEEATSRDPEKVSLPPTRISTQVSMLASQK